MTEVKGALELSEAAAAVAPTGMVRIGCVGGVFAVSTDGGDYEEVATGGADAITGLTGGVTATGPGDVAATVHDLPLDATAVVAPATPATGKGATYVDSTSKNLCVKDDAGVVKHGVQSMTTGLKVLTANSDAGVFSTLNMPFGPVVQVLADADVTINPATDKVTIYYFPAATITGNRIITLGTGGGPATGCCATIARLGTEAFTVTIKDDAGTTLHTIPSATKEAWDSYWAAPHFITSTYRAIA